MKSLLPVQFEILYTFFKLREKAQKKVLLTDVRKEMNARRKAQNQKPISSQLLFYHLSRLANYPFFRKQNHRRRTKYSLLQGSWKLNQNPPLCVHITSSTHVCLICYDVKVCKKKPDMQCLETIMKPKLETVATAI